MKKFIFPEDIEGCHWSRSKKRTGLGPHHPRQQTLRFLRKFTKLGSLCQEFWTRSVFTVMDFHPLLLAGFAGALEIVRPPLHHHRSPRRGGDAKLDSSRLRIRNEEGGHAKAFKGHIKPSSKLVLLASSGQSKPEFRPSSDEPVHHCAAFRTQLQVIA